MITKQANNPKPSKPRIVTAKYPNHVWHIDITAVPIAAGFWTSLLPNTLPQTWPFCWQVAAVIDHHSRRIQALTVWKSPPNSNQIQILLNQAINNAQAKPKYIISDKGCQFWCDGFKSWCKQHSIKPRFGAIGQHGSIAVIERFNRTLKSEALRKLLLPFRQPKMQQELNSFTTWYNNHRPHTTLLGQTPNEVYTNAYPANRKPRHEPRKRWPRGSPCAKPQTLIKGKPGELLKLQVSYHDGKKHLPIVELKSIPTKEHVA